MSRERAGMPFDVSAKPGCAASVVQEDINIFWMGHKPKTMSKLYSHLFEEIELRLAEAEVVGFGFAPPQKLSEKPVIAPIAPKVGNEVPEEAAVSD